MRFTWASLTVVLAVSLVAAPQDVPPPLVPESEASEHVVESPEPVYPPIAKLARITGEVQLEITIDEEGRVVSVRALRGHPLLVPTTVEAVKTWRYRPFLVDGKAAAVRAPVVVFVGKEVPPDERKREEEFQKSYWPNYRKAEEALKRGDYAKAEEPLQKAREIARSAGEYKWLEFSSSTAILAYVLWQQKRNDEAERLYLEVLALRESHGPADDTDLADALQNLAAFYSVTSRPEKAEPLLLRSVKIYQGKLDGETEDEFKGIYGRGLAISRFILAQVNTALQRPDDARHHCREAMTAAKWLREDQRNTLRDRCAVILKNQ